MRALLIVIPHPLVEIPLKLYSTLVIYILWLSVSLWLYFVVNFKKTEGIDLILWYLNMPLSYFSLSMVWILFAIIINGGLYSFFIYILCRDKLFWKLISVAIISLIIIGCIFLELFKAKEIVQAEVSQIIEIFSWPFFMRNVFYPFFMGFNLFLIYCYFTILRGLFLRCKAPLFLLPAELKIAFLC